MAYDKEILNDLRTKFLNHKHTLAVAESVSSGHLQAALSLSKDTTSFFQGGITAYNLGQKARHLNINPIAAEECNCVSEDVAKQMALGVCKLFSADIGLAITGYAAPVPELKVKDLFAYYAICRNNKIIASGKIASENKGIHTVQIYFANQALQKLLSALK